MKAFESANHLSHMAWKSSAMEQMRPRLGLCGGLMYHTSFVSILQTEQSLNSSRVQVLSLILLKRAQNKAGLKLVFHSRNWPVPRALCTRTGGGLVSLSSLKVQLISELLLDVQSEN